MATDSLLGSQQGTVCSSLAICYNDNTAKVLKLDISITYRKVVDHESKLHIGLITPVHCAGHIWHCVTLEITESVFLVDSVFTQLKHNLILTDKRKIEVSEYLCRVLR